jgi:hypothetical protein
MAIGRGQSPQCRTVLEIVAALVLQRLCLCCCPILALAPALVQVPQAQVAKAAPRATETLVSAGPERRGDRGVGAGGPLFSCPFQRRAEDIVQGAALATTRAGPVRRVVMASGYVSGRDAASVCEIVLLVVAGVGGRWTSRCGPNVHHPLPVLAHTSQAAKHA